MTANSTTAPTNGAPAGTGEQSAGSAAAGGGAALTADAIVAALPHPTAVFAADGPAFTVLAANEALLAVSQRPREAVIGRPLAEAFPNASPEDPEASGLAELRASLGATVRTGAPQRMARQRYDLQRPDGVWEQRYWDAVNIPVPGSDGAVGCVLHQTEDVTARVRSEQAAERAERRAEGILEAMADAYFVLDADFRIVAVNGAMERNVGLSREALLGRSIWDAFPGTVGNVFEEHYRRTATEHTPAHFTHDYSDGRLDLVTEVDVYPAPGGGIAAFWRDVTARVRTEAALRASETRYRALFTSIDEGFCVLEVLVDAQGRPVDYRFLETNPAFVRQGGFDPLADGRPSRRMSEIARIEPEWIARYGRVAATGEPTRFTHEAAAFGRTYDVFAFRVDAPEARNVAVLFRDVTAQRTAEGERERLLAVVEAEHERLRTVVLQTPGPLALMEGPEHRFALVNDAYKRVSGGGRDVTGLTPPEAFPELAGSGIYELFDRVYETGEPWDGPETLVRYDRDGTGVQDTWFNLRFEPLRDAEGRVTGIFNFAVDVTDQVRARREVERLLAESERAAAALAESERRFRTVQDASPLGFAIHRPVREGGRPDGRVVDFTLPYVNEAGARIVGHPREHLLAGTVLGIWPGTGPEGVFADYVRVLETGEPGYREILYEHDGLAAGLTLTVVRIGTGADAEIGITFTDVTARLRAEAERDRLFAALGAERERLRAVILHMPSPLALHVGPEHRFELVNAAFRRISGGGRDDTGRTVREAFPELAGQGIVEALDRVYATGEPWIGTEVPIRYDRDGAGLQDTWYDVRYEPVRDPSGAVWGVLNFAVDVTRQVRARQEVERLLAESERARVDAEAARAEAQAANQAKGEFLAVMSHELRTPLNAIGGYAELLQLGIHGPVTDAQRTALARIQASQRHLLGLIAGVLDYSRVEAGAVTYRLVDVAVAEAVAEAETLVAPQLRAKGLGYGWSGAAPGLAVRADREKLQQILLNLLGNAVKFTDARDGVPGRVEVACSVAGDRVRIHVRDTGAGIAAEELERVFEPFVQADQRLTRPHAGVGLGLAISRDLARGMGGDLTAESTPGVGSTFTLSLPRA